MPDDDLSVDPNSQTPSPEPQPGGAPQPAAGGVEPIANPEQLIEFINAAAEAQNRPVMEVVQQLAQKIDSLQQQATSRNEPPPTASDLAERLLTDPEGVFSEQVTKILKEQLAGPLTANFEAQRDERVEARAAEIDEDWGEGFFDQHIRPRLLGRDGVLSRWPIDQQAHPKVIESAIGGILGTDYMDPEKRGTMQEALEKAAKAKERRVAQPPNMMGPGRVRQQPTDQLTPAMRHTLEKFQEIDPNLTEATIKETLRRPNTLSAWQKGATQ